MAPERRKEIEKFILDYPPCEIDCEGIEDSCDIPCKFVCSPGVSAIYGLLLSEIDTLQADLKAAQEEIAALKIILNPRLWTLEMSDVWHQNIPNVQAAFDALRDIILDREE